MTTIRVYDVENIGRVITDSRNLLLGERGQIAYLGKLEGEGPYEIEGFAVTLKHPVLEEGSLVMVESQRKGRFMNESLVEELIRTGHIGKILNVESYELERLIEK